MSEDSHLTAEEVSKADHWSKSVPNLPSLDIIEIDLAQKAMDIWAGRRIIIGIVVLFLGLGYFHTEYGPTEYMSTASLIQESDGSSVGDFGSSIFRSLTGINIPSGGSNNMSAVATGRAPLPASLYPVIISTTDFQKELIYTEFEFSTIDSTMTLIEYQQNFTEASLRDRVYSFITDMTIYLPFRIYDWTMDGLRWVKNSVVGLFASSEPDESSQAEEIQQVPDELIADDRLQSITKEERSVMTWLTPRISLTSSGGVMSITTRMPDPLAAALINAHLIEYIQEYITDYRIEKARQNLDATLERYEMAKERYEQARYELAEFRDQNVQISTEIARIEEQRLSNEASLRSNIYNSVAQEVEQARMVLQQQMPVFNKLEKPNIPSAPSTGSSPLIMVFLGVLGFFTGTALILIKSSSLLK